ncbi:MAG: hypothetical protein ABI612_13150 [Betaproteobacteria bacterium]
MQTSPYTHSPAQLTDVGDRAPAAPVDAPLFAVPLRKLVLLSVCSLGIYQLYWFYRNWQLIKIHTGEDISPFWRTALAPLYCYQCFSRIRDCEQAPYFIDVLPAGFLATGWIATTLMWRLRLPEPFWLISTLSVLFLLPVQMRANRMNQTAAPEHDHNDEFSARDWATTIVGSLFVELVIIAAIFTPAHGGVQ